MNKYTVVVAYPTEVGNALDVYSEIIHATAADPIDAVTSAKAHAHEHAKELAKKHDIDIDIEDHEPFFVNAVFAGHLDNLTRDA
jgi:hypothetical protein